MKKTLLIAFILLLSLQGFSQTRFGIRGGVNLTDLTNLETKKRTDFYAGVFLAIKASEAYTLQPEIMYSVQGATLNNDNYLMRAGNEKLADLKLEFLSIAFINKLTTQNNINFLIGPYIDIRMADNIKNDGYFLEGLFPRMDIGIQLGLGYDINDSLSIEARFKQGFIDMLNENDVYEAYPTDDANFTQVFQFGITYKFNLKQPTKS